MGYSANPNYIESLNRNHGGAAVASERLAQGATAALGAAVALEVLGADVALWGGSTAAASQSTGGQVSQVVIGHYPSYIDTAKQIGASYFDMGNAWTPEAGRAANQGFL